MFINNTYESTNIFVLSLAINVENTLIDSTSITRKVYTCVCVVLILMIN